jgi:anaerobic magnesium-protoporphyrin IX monomethyl ester cyclase
VTLVYPFFKPFHDNSIFRFPPLGLGYIAASLRRKGVSVEIVDGTFLTREEAVAKVKGSKPDILGFYSMFSMKRTSVEMARRLREDCGLLVVGGPLPTLDPSGYLDVFDVVVLGEGEEVMVDLAECYERGASFADVAGVAYLDSGKTRFSAPRGFVRDLDSLPFPARDLFDNDAYKRYYADKFGSSIAPVITSRGCPFSCDFCSRPVFGQSFRTRSAANIVDEVEEIVGLGYDRVWFADDCFTLSRNRVLAVCDELT